MSERIDIWNELVAETYSLDECVIDRLALLAVVEELTWEALTVRTHHREEDTLLEPAHIELAVERIVHAAVLACAWTIGTCEETAKVMVVVRIACEREVETCRNLIAESTP